MPPLRFSAQSLGFLAKVLPEYFTHTGLETLFLTAGVDEATGDSGVNKQRRVLNVIKALREMPPHHAEAVLQTIISDLLEKVTRGGTLDIRQLDAPEANLVQSLERDGWRFENHRLEPTNDEHVPDDGATTGQDHAVGGDRERESSASVAPSMIDLSTSRRVFIVHGRDLAAKDAVARFVEHLGFEAIVLHERANAGRTVLEKFLAEAADAAFALVLLTPDDEGSLVGSSAPELRARQNVVLEFGYFVGLLGRQRVAALVADDVSLPSDLHGLLYIPFTVERDDWKMAVVREMRAVGLPVDMNSI